jgi:hypothetical protein
MAASVVSLAECASRRIDCAFRTRHAEPPFCALNRTQSATKERRAGDYKAVASRSNCTRVTAQGQTGGSGELYLMSGRGERHTMWGQDEC